MRILAHRGACMMCPENTMAAFLKAYEIGAHGIELDVQMTKDGKLVVMHDEYVDRCSNGAGLIGEQTLAELRKLDVGSWFSPEFIGERIPLLSEVLDAFSGKDFYINIEIKSDVYAYDGIEQKIIDCVDRYSMKNQVILSSFNHYSCVEAKKICPDIDVALLFFQKTIDMVKYTKDLGMNAIHPAIYLATDEFMQECNKHELAVNPWFFGEAPYLSNKEKYKAMPFGNIITNYPVEYLSDR